jgi:hypothetical protein
MNTILKHFKKCNQNVTFTNCSYKQEDMCAILFNKNQLQPKSQLRFKSGHKIQ